MENRKVRYTAKFYDPSTGVDILVRPIDTKSKKEAAEFALDILGRDKGFELVSVGGRVLDV